MTITSSQFKILVTGASGTVGRALLPTLISKGYKDIRVLKHKGPVEDVSAEAVEIVQADLTNFEQIQKAVGDVDIICHLGALLGRNEPVDVFQVNMGGTFNLLEACRLSRKVKLFIFASTDATYPAGTAEFTSVIEESQPLNPNTVYGITKVLGEEICIRYSNGFGIPCVRLRFVYVVTPKIALDLFSPNAWLGSAIPEDKEKLEGKDVIAVPLHADSKPICDAVVDPRDLAQAIILCLENLKVQGEVFNLAGPHPVNYEKEAEYLSQKLSKPIVKVRCSGLKPYEVSIARAKEVLGYNPVYSIRKVLEEAVTKFGGK